MKQAVFTMDGNATAYVGYTAGASWNGWATPYFEKAEAMRMLEDFNRHSDGTMKYDEATDSFRVYDTICGDYEEWDGFDTQTEHGKKHLYGIGAYSWIWDKVDKSDIRSLAQQINDFLYDYDTYEHRDVVDDEDEFIEAMMAQLENPHTFVKAYTLLNDDHLKADAKFEKMTEVLTV